MRGRRTLWWAAWLVCGTTTLALLWAWAGGGTGGGGGGGGAGTLPRDTGAPVAGRELPLIFIGGVPRSGTTLMRAMLDAHPLVRCGQETRVIPRILQMRQHWYKSAKEAVRLEEAGVSSDVVDNAIAAFVLEVIARHGEPAPRLCNKDPLVLKMASYVLRLFPNARFVLMVRDGRATVHSIISRQVTITGFDLSSYRQCLSKWNHAVEAMWRECGALGSRCVVVQYERLVLRPREELARLLRALQLPWDERVLHHEQWVGRAGGVALSKVERSSDQVVRALNQEALARWVGEGGVGGVPADVLADAHSLAPMLSVLGYDPWATPPDYNNLKPHAHATHTDTDTDTDTDTGTGNTDHDTYHLPFIHYNPNPNPNPNPLCVQTGVQMYRCPGVQIQLQVHAQTPRRPDAQTPGLSRARPTNVASRFDHTYKL